MLRRHFLKMGSLTAGSLLASPVRPANSAANDRFLRCTLDGDWSIARDENNAGTHQGWFHAPRNEAVPIRVPSILQEEFPGYHGIVWYWKSFQAPEKSTSSQLAQLLFHTVDYYADVWLNGVHLGSHEGGETPFTLDATDALRLDSDNLLAVRVLNPPAKGIDGVLLKQTAHGNKADPYSNGNRYDYGGIEEPVELLYTPPLHITDLQLIPDWKTGVVRVRTSMNSHLPAVTRASLSFTVCGGPLLQPQLERTVQISPPAAASDHEEELHIAQHRLWDIDDPCCYELTVSLTAQGADLSDTTTTHFGFRDFRLIHGYFHLNGRRLFLKCTHTGNQVPFSQVTTPPGAPDLLRMDLLNAKTAGFNMIRFISGVAHPWQLNLCDQLGLMVYEESLASWLLEDSSFMNSRFESSLREMILRDRNHPSLVMWGVLNETIDGPVFRKAVDSLSLVRSFDSSRLVLLSSGRFDGHLEVGSASNPEEHSWQYVWGEESPHATPIKMKYPSGPGTGDFHFYPEVPQSAETKRFLRTLGVGSKPVFLSEYGIGSMMNVLNASRRYEQAGIREDAEDNALMHSMASRLSQDWNHFGMQSAYPVPEMLLEESERAMALHRREGFDLIRSNPQIAGFNLTGMLDHGMTGEGIWRFWRDWKPAAFDAMRDGWSPVRWCLFADPSYLYQGESVQFEAVLANEGVIPAGDYVAALRAVGPEGIHWTAERTISVPVHSPLALPVLSTDVVMDGPTGVYEFVPTIARGISAPYRTQAVDVADRGQLPRLDGIQITAWSVNVEVAHFLAERGAGITDFSHGAASNRECILVGLPGPSASRGQWIDLAQRVAQGSVAIFLEPEAFKEGEDSTRWLPAETKGRIYELHDWLYHKECVAKPSAFFDGLQATGMLRWHRFGPVIPRLLFDGLSLKPSEIHAAAFATGYSVPGGYASGVCLAELGLGAGSHILQSFRISQNTGFPSADRMLVNSVLYASRSVRQPKQPLPGNFSSLLTRIGYKS